MKQNFNGASIHRVTIAQIKRIIPYVVNLKKYSVLIRGRHAIGKSEVVGQFADSIGMKLVERRASQMSEGDLSGVPTVVDGVTTFNPPDWYAECCKHARVLFLDELDRAVTEVRQGFFELADSRKIFGHTLHPGTMVFAAINGGNAEGIHYQVNDMGPAEISRWTVFDLDPTVEEWLSWGEEQTDGQDNVIKVVREFIRTKPGMLEYKGSDNEVNKVYPDRRCWARFSQCIAAETNAIVADGFLVKAMGAAFVGTEAAYAFADYAQNWQRKVSPSEIMLAGLADKTEDYNSREHLELIEQFGRWEQLKAPDYFIDLHYQNLWLYAKDLNGELFMRLVGLIQKFAPRVWEKLILVTQEACVLKYTNLLGISEDDDDFADLLDL